MKLFAPNSLEEACDMLRTSDAPPVPVAGGTDFMLSMHSAAHGSILDISAIDELRAIQWAEDALLLGSLVTFWDVINDSRIAETFPLLIQSAREVGAIQIQTRGTWGGNVMNASPAADGVMALMVYDAQLIFHSTSGESTHLLCDFYTGYKRYSRQPHELLTAIRIPYDEYAYEYFMKVAQRRALAISKVGIAAVRSVRSGLRIVANSMAPIVRRCPTIECLFESHGNIQSPSDILPAVDADLDPIDDIRSTAEYRRNTLCRILYHERENIRGGLL